MASANALNPSLNFTLYAGNTPDAPSFPQSSTSKNYYSSNLNFTITIPDRIAAQATQIFNRSTPPTGRGDANGEPGIGTEQSVLGPLVLSGAEVVADFSANIRQSFSTYHQVYGTENPTELAALGFTTGFS